MTTRGEQMQAQVLAVLKRKGSAMSAYDVLDVLRADHPKIAPPTVYRALNALIEKGGVHRVESLNAFVACNSDGHSHDHASVMSICDDCGSVEENAAPGLMDNLSGILDKAGFAAQRHVIEVHGTCSDCVTEEMSGDSKP
ncbi:MAG: transcriptional repressor [Pseudomonadota bacterium]